MTDMDQQTQLIKLILKAADNGWERKHIIDPEAFWFTPTLLFGDNLSFLKALFPDGPEELTEAEFMAMKLVVLPDNERIAWLYSRVFGEAND